MVWDPLAADMVWATAMVGIGYSELWLFVGREGGSTVGMVFTRIILFGLPCLLCLNITCTLLIGPSCLV